MGASLQATDVKVKYESWTMKDYQMPGVSWHLVCSLATKQHCQHSRSVLCNLQHKISRTLASLTTSWVKAQSDCIPHFFFSSSGHILVWFKPDKEVSSPWFQWEWPCIKKIYNTNVEHWVHMGNNNEINISVDLSFHPNLLTLWQTINQYSVT